MAKEKQKKGIISSVAVIFLCTVMILFDFITPRYTDDDLWNTWIVKNLQLLCGTIAVILLMIQLKIRLFKKPRKWFALLPCLIIALNNFPLISYLRGNMSLVRRETLDFILFGANCLAVGFFEECIFRGVIFSVLAERMTKDRKGFIKTYVFTSLIFGGAHLLNIFGGDVGGTLLQVAYTILTGGLFGYALIKSKNIVIPSLIHAIYNFCGLVLSETGLGSGIVFDFATCAMMAVIAVIIGVYVLYSVWNYSEKEQKELYNRLGVEYKEINA